MAVLMFLLISKIEINILPHPPPKAMGPLQIVWFIFGALVKQGSPLPPKSDVARILCGTWWIFITVVRLFLRHKHKSRRQIAQHLQRDTDYL